MTWLEEEDEEDGEGEEDEITSGFEDGIALLELKEESEESEDDEKEGIPIVGIAFSGEDCREEATESDEQESSFEATGSSEQAETINMAKIAKG